MPEATATFETWAIAEVMGHKQYAGWVSEQLVAGTPLVRVDVPETSHRPGYTKLLGASAIFCLTPCDEAVARAAAEQLERYHDPIPVHIPVQRQLAAGTTVDAELEADEGPSYEDDGEPF